MIIDKIAVILVAFILTIYLSVVYIKKQATENLVILSLLAFAIGVYIPFTIYDIYVPIYIHIPIILFGMIIPIMIALLQYNNIIVSGNLLYRNAKKLYNKENYEAALKEIIKVIEIEGKKSEYLYLLGKCYCNLNDDIHARDSFALAIDINKEDYESYYELGCVLDRTGKVESAIIMLDKAIKLCPEMYEAYEAMGICYTELKKYKEAIKVYKNALKYYPKSYEMYYNIAVLEMQIEKYDDAEKDFIYAIHLNPDLHAAHYNLGNLKYLKGEYDKAIEEYKTVVATNHYSDKAYYKIAMIYAIQKEYDKAMTVIEYLIELNSIYIEKIQNEFIFSNMKNQIHQYLITREYALEEEKQKKNYMRERNGIFKKRKKLEEKIEEEEQLERLTKKPDILNHKLR